MFHHAISEDGIALSDRRVGDSNMKVYSTFDRKNVAERNVAMKGMVPECQLPNGLVMKSRDEYQVHVRRSPLVSLESKYCCCVVAV